MIAGSIVALVTPMHADGAVDWERLAELVEWHVESGTHGIVAVGTTGESATLTVAEHLDVVKFTIERAAKRCLVIAGTGANSTSEAVELTAAAKSLGADACLLVTPYYNKPTQEGLFRHFQHIANAVAIPQILYNVPGRTACDMQNETVERLADISNLVAIKDATGNLERGADLIRRVGDRMTVLSGDDETALELMKLGGKGDISVTANVVPKEMAQMCNAALAGDWERAEAINNVLMPLHRKLFVEANPIPVKWALHQMQRIGSGIRLPLTELSAAQQPVVREAMLAAGVI